MKTNYTGLFCIFACFVLSCVSCKKAETHYYEDPNNSGIGIFSNTGNNVMSCYIGGKPWRTYDRYNTVYGNPGQFEVEIYKIQNAGLMDSLRFDWWGSFRDNSPGGYISLQLAVPAGFGYADFKLLDGKRIKIDSTLNGYFFSNTDGIFNNLKKRNGNIYFNTANMDSVALPVAGEGRMSGLFDVQLDTTSISNGRFDHNLTRYQVHF